MELERDQVIRLGGGFGERLFMRGEHVWGRAVMRAISWMLTQMLMPQKTDVPELCSG